MGVRCAIPSLAHKACTILHAFSSPAFARTVILMGQGGSPHFQPAVGSDMNEK